MNRGFVALIFSLSLHLIVFYALGRLLIDRTDPVQEFRLFGTKAVEFDFTSGPQAVEGFESSALVRNPGQAARLPAEDEWTPGDMPIPVPVVETDSVSSITDSVYSRSPSLAYKLSKTHPFRKRLLPDSSGVSIQGDSLTISEKATNLIQTWKKQYGLDDIGPMQDVAGDVIAQRNLGGGPRASQIPPPQPKDKPNAPRFDFLPSAAQASSMAVLFDKRQATQSELYSKIPPDLPITQEMLNRELDMLVEKGMVTRKQVSPRNLLYFFGMPIEMSSKNRKNPVYLYKPNVEREKLMAFLDSRIYLFNETKRRRPTDSLAISIEVQKLERIRQSLLPREGVDLQ